MQYEDLVKWHKLFCSASFWSEVKWWLHCWIIRHSSGKMTAWAQYPILGWFSGKSILRSCKWPHDSLHLHNDSYHICLCGVKHALCCTTLQLARAVTILDFYIRCNMYYICFVSFSGNNYTQKRKCRELERVYNNKFTKKKAITLT